MGAGRHEDGTAGAFDPPSGEPTANKALSAKYGKLTADGISHIDCLSTTAGFIGHFILVMYRTLYPDQLAVVWFRMQLNNSHGWIVETV
jgi:hypothetical protein